MVSLSKNIKILISDYDGTLADYNHNISQKNSDAIKKWEDDGRYFTIASGRMYAMIKEKTEDVDLTSLVIGRGGAEIVDSKNDKVLYEKLINKKIVHDFLKAVRENDLEVSIEIENRLYSNFYKAENFSSLKVYPLNEFELQDIPKMVIFAVNKDVEKKEELINNSFKDKFPQLHITQINSRDWKVWDVTSHEATKHLATLELLKMLDIKPEEAVAIGDGYNDFSMLSAVGFKVAVDNAVEELKEIADLIIPNSNNDGVAYLIDKLLAAKGEPRPKGRE